MQLRCTLCLQAVCRWNFLEPSKREAGRAHHTLKRESIKICILSKDALGTIHCEYVYSSMYVNNSSSWTYGVLYRMHLSLSGTVSNTWDPGAFWAQNCHNLHSRGSRKAELSCLLPIILLSYFQVGESSGRWRLMKKHFAPGALTVTEGGGKLNSAVPCTCRSPSVEPQPAHSQHLCSFISNCRIESCDKDMS